MLTLRLVILFLVGGSTAGALVVLLGLPPVAAFLIGALVGAVAAIVGPPALRWAVDVWEA
jgi:hypothetical protein